MYMLSVIPLLNLKKKKKKRAVFCGKTCNWMCENFSYIFLCNLGSTCERHDWVMASPIISSVKQYFCNNPDEPDWWDTYMFPCFYIILYIYFLKRMKIFHTSNYRACIFSFIYGIFLCRNCMCKIFLILFNAG